MRVVAISLLLVGLLAACDGPDPDSARLYSNQINEKIAQQCGPGYEAFVRRVPAPTSETRAIDAPLKSIDLFPPIFFAPLDQLAFESFTRGYPDDVRDRLLDLKGTLIRAGAALKSDFARPKWQGYCDRMQEMSRTLRNLG
ncbi:MAG: hypothetical protein O3C65_11235 [Proteobacteria bacterium]|nr:hypothetical protein [Pseudomonadota bacterium]